MRQVTVALSAVAVALAAAVLGLFLWLRTYAPLAVICRCSRGRRRWRFHSQ